MEHWLILGINKKYSEWLGQKLNPSCLMPLKEPDLAVGQFNNMILRVQALAIGGTDKVRQDTIKYSSAAN
ncbi:hypothetical protein B9T26_02550 [Acinetobacter sp. ANC 4169]|uniref:hypothetical protein n=1 Tax=Acinetobacter sp. ANC 4169 TaxID=1977879 RepID=UPI000A354E7C|nr:hypothetical protein [Acinetobacter sp. ANC 4169]OTG76704.1 hypothetical protein B9T26_02550 [Acinetobacter sp. ANC 4169]